MKWDQELEYANQLQEGTENLEIVEEHPEDESLGCRNCGNLQIEPGYQLALCKECRDTLVKHPSPSWVKYFFAIIILIFILSVGKIPASLKAGIDFQRGVQAETAGNYITARKEYLKVFEKYPNSTLLMARLAVSNYFANDIYEASQYLIKLSGREAKNDKLYREINWITERIVTLFIPREEFLELFESIDLRNENLEALEEYVQNRPNDIYAKFLLADLLVDEKRYEQAEKLLMSIIEEHNDFFNAHIVLTLIARQKGEFEQAMSYAARLFDYNQESAEGYEQKAITELMRHQNQLGLELAQRAYHLKPEDPTLLMTLTLAYHANDLDEARDNALHILNQIYSEDELVLISTIINGEREWR